MGAFYRRALSVAFSVFLSAVLSAQEAAPDPDILREPPLRHVEPLLRVIADLQSYIPRYMQEQAIPGVSVALIRDGRIAWLAAFGRSNALTGRPLSPDGVFEVASNSKVAAAYIALRLVERKKLELDRPLDSYLATPWLPPSSPWRKTITLRHVLSHSSGLGHGTSSRECLFPPGSGYSYSALGFQYLQRALEEATGRPLEDTAREMLFQPLGMASSSFVTRPDLTSRCANGHIKAAVPAAIFSALCLVCILVVVMVELISSRLRIGLWRTWRRPGITIGIAYMAAIVAAFILLKMANLREFAWLLAYCGLGIALLFRLFIAAGSVVMARLPWKSRVVRAMLWMLLAGAFEAGMLLLAFRIDNLPVPSWPAVDADAAGSMRSTAEDMAKLLIEVSNPSYLSEPLATQMQTPQVKLAEGISWGLGLGIQESQQGEALWQWGQHIDFQSMSIIYPKLGHGVVVLTNSDLFNPDVAITIAQHAIGGKTDLVRRAVQLQFNYRPL